MPLAHQAPTALEARPIRSLALLAPSLTLVRVPVPAHALSALLAPTLLPRPMAHARLATYPKPRDAPCRLPRMSQKNACTLELDLGADPTVVETFARLAK